MTARKLYTLFIFTFIVSVSYAQTGTIRGKIVDAKTGETLIGASAVIKGTTKGAVANLDGEYEIKNLEYGEYILEVSFVSYKKTTSRN